MRTCCIITTAGTLAVSWRTTFNKSTATGYNVSGTVKILNYGFGPWTLASAPVVQLGVDADRPQYVQAPCPGNNLTIPGTDFFGRAGSLECSFSTVVTDANRGELDSAQAGIQVLQPGTSPAELLSPTVPVNYPPAASNPALAPNNCTTATVVLDTGTLPAAIVRPGGLLPSSDLVCEDRSYDYYVMLGPFGAAQCG